jgi:hypothetical protein
MRGLSIGTGYGRRQAGNREERRNHKATKHRQQGISRLAKRDMSKPYRAAHHLALKRASSMPRKLLATFTTLLLLSGSGCDKSPEKAPNAEVAESEADAPAANTKEASQAPGLEVTVGTEAKKLVAILSHPDQDFGGAEGEACFGYDDQPDKAYCFTLKTEQASWAEVFGENYPLREIRARVPEDKEDAKAIKKPVLAKEDAPEKGH